MTLTVAGQGNKVVKPQQARYKVFALEDEALAKAMSDAKLPGANKETAPALHTVCGLEHYAAISSASGGSKVAMTEAGVTSYTMKELNPGTQYRFIVMAVCDSNCLRQVSQTTPSSTLDLACGGAMACYDQQALYAPAHMSTLAASSSRYPNGYSSSSFTLTIAFLMLGLIITIVSVALLYRKNRRLEQQLSYEMTDTRYVCISYYSTCMSVTVANLIPHPLSLSPHFTVLSRLLQ